MHVCVVIDDDPGRDIGLMRQPGHRFFFATERSANPFAKDGSCQASRQTKRILIAGIGNIFLARRRIWRGSGQRDLPSETFPAGVRVADFGIRGFDLAYALMEGYETTILVDAFPGERRARHALCHRAGFERTRILAERRKDFLSPTR